MPLPRWLARFNRRFINPRTVRKESWPILTHRGRSSGVERRTPLDAAPVDGGFVFLINYDSTKTDWVLNTVAADAVTLRYEGEDVRLVNPRIISQAEAMALVGDRLKPPPAWMKIDEYLWMDRA